MLLSPWGYSCLDVRSRLRHRLAGLRSKILSSDSSKRSDSARLGAAASAGIAAPHTENGAFAKNSDDNTTNPGQDGFRAEAKKRPSRVRYRGTAPVTTGTVGSS